MNASGAASLEIAAMSKRFGANVALADVAMRVPAGTLHALLGENGAGKSTLVKCIIGSYRADRGDVLLDGREVAIAGPRAARALGLGMVYQHFTLVGGMTVAENMVMARPNIPAIVNWRAEMRALGEFMARMPFRVPLDRRVATLAAGEKQKVEILKLLYLGCRFLILDEPTAVLTPAEADEVLRFLRRLVEENKLTVLMITHKFREVTAYADAVTVLRRGKLAGAGAVRDLSPAAMAAMMVGTAPTPARTDRDAERHQATRLAIRALRATRDDGVLALREVSLAVRGGEIVGIAGVSGNGQRELVEVLAGQRRAAAGEIRIDDQPFRFTRVDIRRHGVRCLPEEPLSNAGVARMTVGENLALRDFDAPPIAARGIWLDRAAMRAAATLRIADYNVRPSDPDAPLGALSGGNVQRTILARELSGEVRVLVVANPCFGLDFTAAAEIRARLMAARNRGVAVLLVSEDLDEIQELADRILVMAGGRIAYESSAGEADLAAIGMAMTAL